MTAKDVGSLRTRLSFEDEGNSAGLAGFKQDLKGLRSEMNLAKSGGRDYTTSLKGMREQSDILSRTFKTQQERVKELKHRYDEMVKVKGADDSATKNLASQYNNATAQMNRTEGQLKTLNDEIRKQASPWTTLGKHMTDTGEKMQVAGKHMTEFGKSYSMRVTAPIVASGVAVFKLASDFESAFAGVEKTFPGTVEQLGDLREGIRNMAKEIPASTDEIANVAEAAGQLGIKAESIEDFTRTMIDMGEATNMSSDQAATSFAQFANVVGMSQDDFSKLGSSVVALGNSMATTEADIVGMMMRLSGTGAQVGLSEAQIAALAAAMASVGIKAEAGGSSMSTVMKKITNAVGEGGKSVEGFAKASGMSSADFTKAWENEPIKALDAFIKGLSNSGEEGENLNAILADLGIKGLNETDTLLRMAGASDILSAAVETSSSAWEENSALTDEAATRYATTESQLKIMWNRIKDVGITLGEALIPAIMSAIDAAEPFIKKIEEGAQAFSDMDEEQQQTILKLIGLVAAIGPAAIALGGLTTGIGGVLKVGGGVASMLGVKGGAGLVGRIGLMGLGTNPVGLAVLGVGALAVGIYAVAKASEESVEDILKSIETRKEEIEATDELIASYEKLQGKNKLSTDEVLRYMDIMGELKDAKSEETIAKLTEEQNKLLEKSGFTNEEMEEFLRLNGEIVEKAPETAKAISEQGNAYVDVLDAVKELNAAERERLQGDTWDAIDEKAKEHVKNLEKQRELTDEIKRHENDRSEMLTLINGSNTKVRDLELEIAELIEEGKLATEERGLAILEEIDLLRDAVSEEHRIISAAEQQEELSLKSIENNAEKLKGTKEEIDAFNILTDEYAQMVLLEQGIVAEKGKAIEKVEEEQNKINSLRDDLKKKMDTEGHSIEMYQDQNDAINEQQGKLDEVKKKLSDANKLAGETIYKSVEIKTTPSIMSLNEQLAAPVNKRIRLEGHGFSAISAYAAGSDDYTGGVALVGGAE